MKKISVRGIERYDEQEFAIIRLTGSGAGTAKHGERYSLRSATNGKNQPIVEVAAVEKRTFGTLSAEDAEKVLRPPKNTLLDLKDGLLELYRFRPRWKDDQTALSVIHLRRVQD